MDKMKKIIYPSYEELSNETAILIAQIIAKKPNALLCFPAGETSLGTFAELVKLYRNSKISFGECKIVGLDEWVHLGEMQNENCYHYLKKNLFDLIDLKSENICFFNGEAEYLQNECSLSDQFIKSNDGIDMMLLGVGMNGHIALNEPGTSFELYSHIVELDDITLSVGQKYFSSKIMLSQGITLGMKHMMETKTVILQISGEKKSHIAKQLIETEITNEFPASLVKLHPNSFLLLDSDAC